MQYDEIQKLVQRVLYNVPRIGNIFIVNGISGDDHNLPAKKPETPLLKIATAIGECVDDHDDYIFVIDCWQQDTFPITIDKNRVHIIGIDNENGKFPRMAPTGDTAIFIIDAEYWEIAGFSLASGANHAAIEWAASKGRAVIRRCWLGHTGTGQDGIKVVTYDAPEMLIKDCIFGAGLTRDGIRIEHNMTRGIIRRCMFKKVAGIGIDVTGDMALGMILDNRFHLPSDTEGKAITLGASCADVFVDGNRANYGKTAMDANPYKDAGAASNTWGLNHKAGVSIMPA